MSNKQLKVKSVTSLGNIIVQLESLIQSFKNGYLTIISNNKALILQPQDPIRFDMETSGKAHKPGARQQLSVRFKWQRKPDTWNSMIQTSTEDPASGQFAEAACKAAVCISQQQEESTPGDITNLDAVAELSPNEVQTQEKPQRKSQPRKPQPRKPAATRKRKTRV